MMKNRQNNKHHGLCARQRCPCFHKRGGSRHSHEASTTEKLKAARKEAHPTTGGTASLSILFGQKKKKKNPKGTQAALPLVAPGSELAGAAGVTLQEAHNGRVALGPSDELFQGELS